MAPAAIAESRQRSADDQKGSCSTPFHKYESEEEVIGCRSAGSNLPSSTMTIPEYIRIHANTSPSILREIVKDKIFPHDDSLYLERLVEDVGGMDYVFRFLWFDGPKPERSYEEWITRPVRPPSQSSTTRMCASFGSMGETNSRSLTGVSRRTVASVIGAIPPKLSESEVGSDIDKVPMSSYSEKDAPIYGRSWIQYCCYHDAHKCLHWIFREVVRNHWEKIQQESEPKTQNRRRSIILGMSSSTRSAYIIKHLLEYPSQNYCATHYVAVAALRNSYQCLSLLLQYGSLDANLFVNAHGSTAAHLAAWKDNTECLHVLASGCYNNDVYWDSDDIVEDLSVRSECTLSDRDSEITPKSNHSSRDAFSPLSSLRLGHIKSWAANWNLTNELGETPIHIAAREGCCAVMQFFLDMVIRSYETSVIKKSMSDDMESQNNGPIKDNIFKISSHLRDEYSHNTCTIDFSMRNNEGMDCTALAAKNNRSCIIELLASAIVTMSGMNHDPKPDSNDESNLKIILHDHSFPKLPQSIKVSQIRRRTKSEPVNIQLTNIDNLSALTLQSNTSVNQSNLPHYFPSLNLNNILEQYNHETPIHVAARHGSVSVIKCLFDSGICNTAARDSLGQTALHIAVLFGQVEVCQLFVNLSEEKFKNFDVVDILGRTPLYIACSIGNPSIARILTPISNWRILCHERKKCPSGPLYTNVAHQSSLHAAVVNDHVNTVSTLLECGVDINLLDGNGRTAINAAAKMGYYEMIQMLILHGADVNSRSSKGGPTPFQKAKKYKHTDVADLLYEFGGR